MSRPSPTPYSWPSPNRLDMQFDATKTVLHLISSRAATATSIPRVQPLYAVRTSLVVFLVFRTVVWYMDTDTVDFGGHVRAPGVNAETTD